MARTAYDTILELMIHAPRSIHNATVAYHQLLLVCGNGFLWNYNGRIVRESEVDDETDKDANETEYEERVKSITKQRAEEYYEELDRSFEDE